MTAAPVISADDVWAVLEPLGWERDMFMFTNGRFRMFASTGQFELPTATVCEEDHEMMGKTLIALGRLIADSGEGE